MNLALDKIKQGRFFLKTAEEIGFLEVDKFRYCVEASIVAARSVTLLLQKQYKNTPGFSEWYLEIQNAIKEDSLSSFLLEKRNYILKQGTADINKVTFVTISAAIEVNDAINIKVVGGAWKSRLKNLLPNFKNSFMFRWKGWKQRFIGKKRIQNISASHSYQNFYFAESEWANKPVIELIKCHLDNLESKVNKCAQLFGDHVDDN